MAQPITIEAQARDPQKNKGTGNRAARKLRAAGRIPAIVYGHKQAPQPVSITHDDAWLLLKKTAHLASLRIDGTSETVLVRDLQWDHLSKDILHVDFARVSADEEIETDVNLHLHGTAPGTLEGGVLEQLVHVLRIVCRAGAIPDDIRVEVGGLQLNQGIHVRDLALPEGVRTKVDPDRLLVHVVTRSAAPAPTVTEGAKAEPELIRKPDEKEKDKKEETKEK